MFGIVDEKKKLRLAVSLTPVEHCIAWRLWELYDIAHSDRNEVYTSTVSALIFRTSFSADAARGM